MDGETGMRGDFRNMNPQPSQPAEINTSLDEREDKKLYETESENEDSTMYVQTFGSPETRRSTKNLKPVEPSQPSPPPDTTSI